MSNTLKECGIKGGISVKIASRKVKTVALSSTSYPYLEYDTADTNLVNCFTVLNKSRYYLNLGNIKERCLLNDHS